MTTKIPNHGRILTLLTFFCSASLIIKSIVHMKADLFFFVGVTVLGFIFYCVVRLIFYRHYLILEKSNKTLTINKLLYSRKVFFEEITSITEFNSVFRSGIVVFCGGKKVKIIKPFIEKGYDLFVKELNEIRSKQVQ